MRHGWLPPDARSDRGAQTRRIFPPALADVAEEQLRAGVHAEPLADAFTAMAAKDWCALVAQIQAPILIVNGERDSMARRGEGFAAAAATMVEIIAGAGHACNLDQPEAFDRVVRQFLRCVEDAVVERGIGILSPMSNPEALRDRRRGLPRRSLAQRGVDGSSPTPAPTSRR